MTSMGTASPQDIDTLQVPSPAPPSGDKISAYYSLVFPNFTYYLQTLTVTIGRRCIPSSSTAASSSDSTQVDVDIGPLKSVSRLHAKIEYEEEEERFVLVVIGRNGAWVDGVWSGSGSKVALSERSQIQIASRTFHFVLPPPAVPEDSPSPSSQSSATANRLRSPSVDITSLSPPSSMPSHSPPPPPSTLPPPPPIPEPQLPNANQIGKTSKKRKKGEAEIHKLTKPEVMPPKPAWTYSQACYRAIKALGGKATLQDIVGWMMDTYDYYKYTEGNEWKNSVRHNLSSNQAFKKMERCAGERGKGFFWSVDEKFEHTMEAKVKAADAAASTQTGSSSTSSQNHNVKSTSKKKEKGASLLEPPLKRSVRDLKAGPLPPPLTSTPLVMKSSSTPTPSATSYPYSRTPYNTPPVTSEHTSLSPAPPPPGSWPPNPSSAPISQATSPPPPTTPAANQSPLITSLPPDLRVPLIIGQPPSLPSSSASTSTSTLESDPIILRAGVLYLDPSVFYHLTPEQLKELEALGAMKAIEILKGYIVNYFKAKKKVEAGKGRGRGRGRGKKGGGMGRGGGAVGLSVSGPFTNAPLPARGIQHTSGQQVQDRDTQHSKMNVSTPVEVHSKPPVPVPVDSEPPMSSLAPSPVMGSLAPPPPIAAPIPNGIGSTGRGEVASPILIVDDIDDDLERQERPMAKRRRLDVLDVGMDIEVM